MTMRTPNAELAGARLTRTGVYLRLRQLGVALYRDQQGFYIRYQGQVYRPANQDLALSPAIVLSHVLALGEDLADSSTHQIVDRWTAPRGYYALLEAREARAARDLEFDAVGQAMFDPLAQDRLAQAA